MTTKGKRFNVILPDEAYYHLTLLANSLDCSRGKVLRDLIKRAHAMTFKGTPVCVNGHFCLVPHLHAPTVYKDPPSEEAA